MVDKIKNNGMGGARGTYGRGVYSVLMGIREGKRTFGKPKRRWEDNTTNKLQKMSC